MPSEDFIRLRHMFDAAEEARSFIIGRKREDLSDDRMLVLALVKDIEIIGEAAYRISDATKAKYTDIPWDDIVGMRHRMVHAYFDINLDILWRTVSDDLPDLMHTLRKIINTV